MAHEQARSRGRPRRFDLSNIEYGRQMNRCRVIDRISGNRDLCERYNLGNRIRLVRAMTRKEVGDALKLSIEALSELLQHVDGRAPRSDSSGLRDFYYEFWAPGSKFSIKVARLLFQMLPPDYTSADIWAAARQVSDAGLRPGSSNPVHLPPGNIVKHLYQNVRAIKAEATD